VLTVIFLFQNITACLIMNHKYSWRILITTACLTFVIASLVNFVPTRVFQPPVSAQSELTLKSDIISLKARLSRLEQEVTSLRSFNTRPRNSSVPKQPSNSIPQNPNNPPVINGQSVGNSDPMFERLATLLIELKEDVRNIDRRLTKIEQAV
jgi:hypothetical protein